MFARFNGNMVYGLLNRGSGGMVYINEKSSKSIINWLVVVVVIVVVVVFI